jgi:hypothetical protein
MVPSPTVPDPEVPAKVSRRRFTAGEKARILDAYESASDIEPLSADASGFTPPCFQGGANNEIRADR